MVTKEQKFKKYCCFYVSDFHLEMILLPYIKNNINKTKFIIFTEKKLLESMKILLDRTNLDKKEKEEILKLNWNNNKENISNLKLDEVTIIINGNNDYISKKNEELKKVKYNIMKIIDCYNINEQKTNIAEIQTNYDEILNTKNSCNSQQI